MNNTRLVKSESWHFEGVNSVPNGAVLVQPFGFEIPIFFNTEDMISFYRDQVKIEENLLPSPCGNSIGHMVWIETKNQGIYFGLYLRPDVTNQTIVHECTHIVDAIFEQCQVDVSWNNTETRAYLMGRLFEDVKSVFEEYRKKSET